MANGMPGPDVHSGSVATSGDTGLRVERLVSGYAGARIVRGVSMAVPPSQISVIVGPNGSGKSTLIKTLFGLVKPLSGAVYFDGENLSGVAPVGRLGRGMGYVPQLPSIFPSMSVQENLEMGLYCHRNRPETQPLERAFEIFPQLADRRDALASTLSGGERRMLEISRSLLLSPSLLLLDEPSVGLSPALTGQMFTLLRQLCTDLGVGMLIVEQNAKTALEACDTGLVLVSGRVAYRGDGRELLANSEVRQAFLGGGPET